MREYSAAACAGTSQRGVISTPISVLDRVAVGEVVDQRRAVVEAVDVRDQVVPGVVLALLLEAAVQVAAVHVGAQDRSPSSSAMIWIVPCVAGCDGPMLTMTVSSRCGVVERRADRVGDAQVHVSVPPRGGGELAGPRGTARAAARAPSGSPCAAGGRRSPRTAGSAAGRRCREADAVHLVALALHERGRAVERGQRVHLGSASGTRAFRRTRTLCGSSRSARRPRSAARAAASRSP
jgi:hypothetical protein